MVKKSTTKTDKKKNKSMANYWILGISLFLAFIITLYNIGQGLVQRDFFELAGTWVGAFIFLLITINILYWISTKF